MGEHSLAAVLDAQRGIVSRAQAVACVGEKGVRQRLGAGWQVIFPGVYAAFRESLSQDQRMWAAFLYAGDRAVFTDRVVIEASGVRFLPDEPHQLHLLVPWEMKRRSLSFLRVSRTRYMPDPVQSSSFAVAPLRRRSFAPG